MIAMQQLSIVYSFILGRLLRRRRNDSEDQTRLSVAAVTDGDDKYINNYNNYYNYYYYYYYYYYCGHESRFSVASAASCSRLERRFNHQDV